MINDSAVLLLLFPAVFLMLLLWFWQKKSKNAGIADAGWAFCMVWMAIAFALISSAQLRGWLIAAMGGAWALRLGLFIWLDRVKGRPEDRRYATIRSNRGDGANRFFLLWFLAQVPFALLFGSCFYAAIQGEGNLLWALPVYVIAVGGELLSDWQLAQFRSDTSTRGTTCQVGLWRYSRHPNYFFEWLHWFTYVILAFGGAWFWWSFIGPAVMLFMLFKVSGIPLTEARALESRSDYADYQQRTSVFIPWFPKRKAD